MMMMMMALILWLPPNRLVQVVQVVVTGRWQATSRLNRKRGLQ